MHVEIKLDTSKFELAIQGLLKFRKKSPVTEALASPEFWSRFDELAEQDFEHRTSMKADAL